MEHLELTKTFRDDDNLPGSERWATYHWGDLAIEEYQFVTWRGTAYHAETADNPFSFSAELSDAVMTLDSWELSLSRPWMDTRENAEWWSTQQPGLLLSLEAKADGTLWAEVWTGLLELWGGSSRKITIVPQKAFENWNELVLLLNGSVWSSPVTVMVGPVGLVSELALDQDDKPSHDLDPDVWGEVLP